MALEKLAKHFNESVKKEHGYVAVQIKMDKFHSDKIITNNKHNVDSKLAYFK